MSSDSNSKEIVEKTIELWQPQSPAPMTQRDAEEIIGNLAGFFDLLYKLELRSNEKDKKI